MSSQPYPRTWTEFLDWFSSEDACLAYLEGLRWPNGFICPSCGVAGVPYRASRVRMMCRDCGHQSTVTAGTIFDKTRTPVSYTHLRAHETPEHLVCRLLLEKKK